MFSVLRNTLAVQKKALLLVSIIYVTCLCCHPQIFPVLPFFPFLSPLASLFFSALPVPLFFPQFNDILHAQLVNQHMYIFFSGSQGTHITLGEVFTFFYFHCFLLQSGTDASVMLETLIEKFLGIALRDA